MVNPKMKTKNASHLSKLKLKATQGGTRYCDVDACMSPCSPQTARYCGPHRALLNKSGNPTGIIPRERHYATHLAHVERLYVDHAKNPSTLAALEVLKAWIRTCLVAHQSKLEAFRKHAPAEDVGIRIIQQGLLPITILTHLAGCFSWSMATGSCREYAGELQLALANTLMGLMPGGSSWKITPRRELGKWIHEALFGYLSNVHAGVVQMLEADKVRTEALREPFTNTNITE